MLIYVLNSKISQVNQPKLCQNRIFIEYSLKMSLSKEIFKTKSPKALNLKKQLLNQSAWRIPKLLFKTPAKVQRIIKTHLISHF